MVLKASDTEECFSCHKLVLAASSTYFDKMFGGNMSESRAEEVHLKNISGLHLIICVNWLPIFNFILNLMYLEDTEFTEISFQTNWIFQLIIGFTTSASHCRSCIEKAHQLCLHFKTGCGQRNCTWNVWSIWHASVCWNEAVLSGFSARRGCLSFWKLILFNEVHSRLICYEACSQSIWTA